ncbi:MAG: hypothetical protein JW699_02175 [Chitinispirillaceae bacterium]|nr:hypothetical protein [Chitinispirillaceae bacterium]
MPLGRHLLPCIDSIMPFFERIVVRQYDLFHCTNPMNFPKGLPSVAT